MGFARENTVEGPTELRAQPRLVCNGCKHHDEAKIKMLGFTKYRAVCRHEEIIVDRGDSGPDNVGYDVRGSYRKIQEHIGMMTNT